MRIVTARRISQVFFLLLLVWFCLSAGPGEEFWQGAGPQSNLLLELDPLVGIAAVLSTGTVYRGLLWGLATVVATILLGRVFCGWICPFGTIHQFVGWLGRRGKTQKDKLKANRYRRAQSVKYYVLLVLLTAAAGGILRDWLAGTRQRPSVAGPVLAAVLLLVAAFVIKRKLARPAAAIAGVVVLAGLWVLGAWVFRADQVVRASLQTGLLDPISLVYRSFNLVLLPLADTGVHQLWPMGRSYEVAWLIGLVFLAAVLLNLLIPRFYCRFVCPLGALLGVLSRPAIWRIGKKTKTCPGCAACETDCEGACNPTGRIRLSECVVCFNCLDNCPEGAIAYQGRISAAGERTGPDISRRGVLLSLLSGLAAVPILRLTSRAAADSSAGVIRPPGALGEVDFLDRCIKCGQCMRVCPTNVIQPAGLEGGLEGLWTPVLNNRIGTSGCQLNCVACGQVCPTAAIRPISLDEKLGRGAFEGDGPIRLGTAFVDRGRCLPWAMNTPCIVCQENCPVSPKAIYLREQYSTVRDGRVKVEAVEGPDVRVDRDLPEDAYATGDYFCRRIGRGSGSRRGVGPSGPSRRRIAANSRRTILLEDGASWTAALRAGDEMEIQVRLQQPLIDPDKCIGCGICEHECPVGGRAAIRVGPAGQTRNGERSLLI